MKRVGLLSILFCGAVAASITQPKFLARRDYPSAPGIAAAADVNGDHIPDLITINGFGIQTLLGNGNGTFRIGPTTNPGIFQLGDAEAVPIDLNGDGKIDLIFATGGNLEVCFGNGDGTFQAAVSYGPAGGGYLVVGDFNGDGIPDAAVAGASGIWLYIGKGGGVFNPGVLTPISPSMATNNVSLTAADFNKDGHLDLAVVYRPQGQPNGFLVLFGNGNGTFQPPVFYGIGSPAGITAGDVNGDGYPDIVVAGVTIFLNNGHGGFTAAAQVSLPGSYVAIGDLNGDGIQDLVSSLGYVSFGEGHGRFAPPSYHPVEGSDSSLSVIVVDLLNNGINDIVAGRNGATSVILNLGKGALDDGEWIPEAGSGNCGAAADFNGDGIPDLALPTTAGMLILLGTGKASAPYTPGTTITLSGPGCPITGDVNGDGIPDLLEGANSLGGVGVYLGNGDGTFRLASVIPFGVAINMVLGDFNHDGKQDVATSSNQLALGNGDGTFQSPLSIVANPLNGFNWIAAGDVNNDGWTDIVVSENNGGYVLLLLNDQQGGFTPSAIANDTPTAVMLADLNGDHNLDVVVTSEGEYAAIYLGNGKGQFKLVQNKIPYPFVDQQPAQVGDVNGDGIPDLLLPADGSIGIALGTGKGTFLTPFVIGAGPQLGQILMENLHGQSAAAGLPDLVAPDGTGAVMVLLNLTQ